MTPSRFLLRSPVIASAAMGTKPEVHKTAVAGFGAGTNDLYDRSGCLSHSAPDGVLTVYDDSELVRLTMTKSCASRVLNSHKTVH